MIECIGTVQRYVIIINKRGRKRKTILQYANICLLFHAQVYFFTLQLHNRDTLDIYLQLHMRQRYKKKTTALNVFIGFEDNVNDEPELKLSATYLGGTSQLFAFYKQIFIKMLSFSINLDGCKILYYLYIIIISCYYAIL